jgi:AcrR family transcriptional regulator
MTERRRGSRESDTRAKILDAARDLLLEEGYGAITTRRIGDRAGVRYQLVHYYFSSLDELFIDLFRQGAEANLARLDELAAGEVSLRTFWRVNSDASGGKLMTEFIALANHRPELRREIVHYARSFRKRQAELAERALEHDGIPTTVPPVVIALLTLALAETVALDRSIGFEDGHAEAQEWIEGWLAANTEPDAESDH